jgi:Aminopeptidase I zinc metalloprotease (M18)
MLAQGFVCLEEGERWQLAQGGRYYVVRGGASMIVFVQGSGAIAETCFRIVGAHTDSPGLAQQFIASGCPDQYDRQCGAPNCREMQASLNAASPAEAVHGAGSCILCRMLLRLKRRPLRAPQRIDHRLNSQAGPPYRARRDIDREPDSGCV